MGDQRLPRSGLFVAMRGSCTEHPAILSSYPSPHERHSIVARLLTLWTRPRQGMPTALLDKHCFYQCC